MMISGKPHSVRRFICESFIQNSIEVLVQEVICTLHDGEIP